MPRSTSARRAAAWSPAGCDGGRVSLEEAHRFPNRPVRLPDGLHWNLLALFTEALDGLRRAGAVDGVGVDTWGVDYGLLDGDGPLLGLPVSLSRRAHRRDGRARIRACPPGGAVRDHRHPDAADQHRLPAAGRRGRRRARRRRSASRSCPTCSPTGSAASRRTSARTPRRPGCSTRAAATGRAALIERLGLPGAPVRPARRRRHAAGAAARPPRARAPRPSTRSRATTRRPPSPPPPCATSTRRSSRAARGRWSGWSCPSRCSATPRARRT